MAYTSLVFTEKLLMFTPSTRARHVYEKVGFRYEGTGRDALWFDEQWIVVHYMSILETDLPLSQ